MKVTVVDYGVGNLHSLVKALEGAGRSIHIEPDARSAVDTDLIVLPGVGAFAPAAAALESSRARLKDAVDGGLPCLGICLGMQLLFSSSEEGPGAGLGVIAGTVTRLKAHRWPQIGWNSLEDVRDKTISGCGLTSVYYANGFACRAEDENDVVAWSTHEGDRFPAAIRRGSVMGVQFHPEKSSTPGVRFIHDFLGAVGR